MTTHLLTRQQFLPRSPDDVFPFFESPENLSLITPPWLGFRMLTPLPMTIGVGSVIDYVIRWLGIRLRWTTLITAHEAPRTFVDQQLSGPYCLWHHVHTFEPVAGGTLMKDAVSYALPLGVLGELAHALVVRRQLRTIFDYRADVIARIFQAQPGSHV